LINDKEKGLEASQEDILFEVPGVDIVWRELKNGL